MTGAKTTWWLDTSALPDLLWARLEVHMDGTAHVLDLDGKRHTFNSERDAQTWLREDEYNELRDLQQDGDVDTSIQAPIASSDAALVPLMHVRYW